MLEEILAGIEPVVDPNVLVGFDTADDAGVYRLSDDLAIVQSVDFFTPVVDDPSTYGQIAASNALSDLYAMGAQPLFALSVLGFPEGELETSVLSEVVRGGSLKMAEAGVPVIGGHSVQDREIKFGYCVTGKVDPKRIWRNTGAKPGDVLVLTEPLGLGIISTGVKFKKIDEATEERAVEVMLRLNRAAAEALQPFEVHAVTDITGFGLIGHAFEMAKGSGVVFVLDPDSVPVIEGTVRMAEKKMLPGGILSNRNYVGNHVDWSGVSDLMQNILLDPQTSGGLLVALEKEAAEAYLDALRTRGLAGAAIGRVGEAEAVSIRFGA
ncbi:MAG: selenide, water dikinase SelD [Acidobacteriota bacterium]|nr:MAG: selenide, water dikinase SelD [Acidobacteriota bacterium]